MSCYECKWPNLQRTREGEVWCPRCGTKAPNDAASRPRSKAKLPLVASIYTLVLGIFALAMPFFVPLIVKVSLANP